VRSRVARKIVFTVPFYSAYGAQPLCLLDRSPQGYKAGGQTSPPLDIKGGGEVTRKVIESVTT
jgi:hypothetical protein